MTAPSTSQGLVFMRALADALAARPTLAGPPAVTVKTFHPGIKLPSEGIFLLGFVGDQEWAPYGRLKKEEEFVVAGSIYSEKAGLTDLVAEACQDRVMALLAEVEATLRADTTVAGTVRVASITHVEFDQAFGDKSRNVECRFQIEAKVRI